MGTSGAAGKRFKLGIYAGGLVLFIKWVSFAIPRDFPWNDLFFTITLIIFVIDTNSKPGA